MRIVVDQAAAEQSPIHKLRVEFRNAGEKDLLLNLGIMTRHGAEPYPTAVSLIVVDLQGKEKWLELKRPHLVSVSADSGRVPGRNLSNCSRLGRWTNFVGNSPVDVDFDVCGST